MPGNDREYIYSIGGEPEASKASNQSSGNDRAGGLKDDTVPHDEIMQKEDMKNKGTNQDMRDGKVGTEPGTKK